MPRLILAVSLLVAAPSTERTPPPSPWGLAGMRANAYALDTVGNVFSDGASVTLRRLSREPAAATDFVTAAKVIEARPYHHRRVRLEGEIKTTGAATGSSGGATLWMRLDGASGSLALDNGMDRSIKGTSAWTPFAVSFIVPDEAQSMVFGVLLAGGGDADVRGLRLVGLDLPTDGAMSDVARRMIDSALAIAKTRSVFRDTISWNVVEPMIRASAAGAETAAETHAALRLLVGRLGDHHSGFLPPASANAMMSGGRDNPPVSGRMVEPDIAYLNIPAYLGVEPMAMQAFVRRAFVDIADLAPAARCGWIVDLRQNGGGNMNPMLGALRPFLGDGTLGFFISPGRRSPWNATFVPDVVPPQSLQQLANAPVAVITGPRTASSGEIVAISFIGRENTRSFGQPSGGFSSGNTMYPLPDGSRLNITSAIDADRRGKTYGGVIAPDEPVAESSVPNEDAPLASAMRWLRTLPGCGR